MTTYLLRRGNGNGNEGAYRPVARGAQGAGLPPGSFMPGVALPLPRRRVVRGGEVDFADFMKPVSRRAGAGTGKPVRIRTAGLDGADDDENDLSGEGSATGADGSNGADGANGGAVNVGTVSVGDPGGGASGNPAAGGSYSLAGQNPLLGGQGDDVQAPPGGVTASAGGTLPAGGGDGSSPQGEDGAAPWYVKVGSRGYGNDADANDTASAFGLGTGQGPGSGDGLLDTITGGSGVSLDGQGATPPPEDAALAPVDWTKSYVGGDAGADAGALLGGNNGASVNVGGGVSVGNPNGDADANTIDGGKYRLDALNPAPAGDDSGLVASPSQGLTLSGGKPIPGAAPQADSPESNTPRIAVKLHSDCANLSNAVYQDDEGVKEGLVPADYRVVSPQGLNALNLPPAIFRDDGSGFVSALYQNKKTGKYVLAFRGTEIGWNPFDEKDLNADGWQGIGHGSSQYNDAINVARLVSKMVGPGNLTYTGHSLGGGLGTAAALVTKNPAVTFNAAAVNPATLAPYRTNDNDANRLITAYHIPGEVVGDLQGLGTTPVGGFFKKITHGEMRPPPNTQGNTIELEPKFDGSGLNPFMPPVTLPLHRHYIKEFLDH